jgi:hypothetical protein
VREKQALVVRAIPAELIPPVTGACLRDDLGIQLVRHRARPGSSDLLLEHKYGWQKRLVD